MDPTLRLGERLTLTCAVTTGDLPLTMSWVVNEAPVGGRHVKILQINSFTSILSIDSLQLGHSGNYSCVVRNPAARVTQSQLVLIRGTQSRHLCHSWAHYVPLANLYLSLAIIDESISFSIDSIVIIEKV